MYYPALRTNWQEAAGSPYFLVIFVLTSFSSIAFFLCIGPYLNFIEARHGCVLEDELLKRLPSIDVSVFIFLIIYTGSLCIIFYCIAYPWRLVRGIQIFILMNIVRALSLYFTPLNPPEGIIPLHDPLLNLYIYNDHTKMKDLFFSGHTATLVFFVLMSRECRILKRIFMFFTVAMAALLLIQHCHYTIDIIGAMAMTYFSYGIIKYVWKKLRLPVAEGRCI